jgi:phytoene dehydrogenase-like protein
VGGRVAVIGAGPNGLVCAIRLAAAGLEVSVLEQASGPGGGVKSAEDTLPGFVHDRCAGFFPLTAASPAFRGLGLERHGLQWVDPPIPMAHPFVDGSAIALHRDLNATVASLERAAARAGSAWRSLVEPLLANGDTVVRVGLEPFPPVAPALMLAVKLRRRAIELARLALGSAASMGHELFGDDRPTAWLCGSTTHSDLSPGAACGAALALGLKVLGHLVGWPFPRGGAGRLTDAMVGRLGELGGAVRCGAPVERILSRRGRVAAVELRRGEVVPADAVVAAVSAAPLAAMLPDDALPARLLERLRRWRYGLGTFKLDWALSGPVPWEAAEARRAAVVHVGDTLEAMFRAAQEAGLGRVPLTPTMVVGQHTLHDPSRGPDGGHTLYAYTHVPNALDVEEEEVAERVEERIERFAPGFRRLVLARALRSPATLERENPSLVGGDLGGGSYELDQQLVFRPAPELVRYRTPLRGLYLAGASVHPGGGVHGSCGQGAARALLADRSPVRFWR